MKSKPDVVQDTKVSFADALVYTNVEFGGRATAFMAFYFIKNKLHTGVVSFKPPENEQIMELYQEIRGDLTEKYGESSDVTETYGFPYLKEPEFYVSQILQEKATFSAKWYSANKKGTGFENEISLEILPSMEVRLSYKDGFLSRQATDRVNSRNLDDY